jgi:hypothetical protein
MIMTSVEIYLNNYTALNLERIPSKLEIEINLIKTKYKKLITIIKTI